MPSVTLLQRAAPASAAVLVALALAGCGGPPTDASKTEFCVAVAGQSWADDLDDDSDGDDFADAFRKWGDELNDIGTPDGISDDAREGFEITVDYLRHVEGDDFDELDQIGPANEDLSDEEAEKVTAFDEYVTTTCQPDPGVDLPEATDG